MKMLISYWLQSAEKGPERSAIDCAIYNTIAAAIAVIRAAIGTGTLDEV